MAGVQDTDALLKEEYRLTLRQINELLHAKATGDKAQEVLDRVRARRLSTGALQHTQPVVQPSQPAAQEYDQSTEDSPAGAGPSSAPTITLQSATLQPSRAPSASLSAQATPRLQAYPPASAQFKAHPRTDVVSHAISTAATTPEKALPDSVQNSPGLHARNSPTPPPPAPQAQEQPPQTARGPHQAPQSQDDSSNAPQPRADEALVIKGVAGPPAVQPAQANGNATHTVPREGPVASGSTAATCAMEQHKHGQAVTCVSEPMTAAPSPAAVANEPQGPQSPPAASRPPLPRPSSDTAPSAPAIPAANISPAASPAATAAAAAAPAATQADPASPLTQPQQPASSGAAAAAPSPAGTPKKQVAAPAAAAAGQDSCVPSPSAPAAADDVPGWLAMVRKLRDALPVGALSPLSRRRNKRATHPAEAAAADSNTNKSASGAVPPAKANPVTPRTTPNDTANSPLNPGDLTSDSDDYEYAMGWIDAQERLAKLRGLPYTPRAVAPAASEISPADAAGRARSVGRARRPAYVVYHVADMLPRTPDKQKQVERQQQEQDVMDTGIAADSCADIAAPATVAAAPADAAAAGIGTAAACATAAPVAGAMAGAMVGAARPVVPTLPLLEHAMLSESRSRLGTCPGASETPCLTPTSGTKPLLPRQLVVDINPHHARSSCSLVNAASVPQHVTDIPGLHGRRSTTVVGSRPESPYGTAMRAEDSGLGIDSGSHADNESHGGSDADVDRVTLNEHARQLVGSPFAKSVVPVARKASLYQIRHGSADSTDSSNDNPFEWVNKALIINAPLASLPSSSSDTDEETDTQRATNKTSNDNNKDVKGSLTQLAVVCARSPARVRATGRTPARPRGTREQHPAPPLPPRTAMTEAREAVSRAPPQAAVSPPAATAAASPSAAAAAAGWLPDADLAPLSQIMALNSQLFRLAGSSPGAAAADEPANPPPLQPMSADGRAGSLRSRQPGPTVGPGPVSPGALAAGPGPAAVQATAAAVAAQAAAAAASAAGTATASPGMPPTSPHAGADGVQQQLQAVLQMLTTVLQRLQPAAGQAASPAVAAATAAHNTAASAFATQAATAHAQAAAGYWPGPEAAGPGGPPAMPPAMARWAPTTSDHLPTPFEAAAGMQSFESPLASEFVGGGYSVYQTGNQQWALPGVPPVKNVRTVPVVVHGTIPGTNEAFSGTGQSPAMPATAPVSHTHPDKGPAYTHLTSDASAWQYTHIRTTTHPSDMSARATWRIPAQPQPTDGSDAPAAADPAGRGAAADKRWVHMPESPSGLALRAYVPGEKPTPRHYAQTVATAAAALEQTVMAMQVAGRTPRGTSMYAHGHGGMGTRAGQAAQTMGGVLGVPPPSPHHGVATTTATTTGPPPSPHQHNMAPPMHAGAAAQVLASQAQVPGPMGPVSMGQMSTGQVPIGPVSMGQVPMGPVSMGQVGHMSRVTSPGPPMGHPHPPPVVLTLPSHPGSVWQVQMQPSGVLRVRQDLAASPPQAAGDGGSARCGSGRAGGGGGLDGSNVFEDGSLRVSDVGSAQSGGPQIPWHRLLSQSSAGLRLDLSHGALRALAGMS